MPYIKRDKDKKITGVFVWPQYFGQERINNLSDPDLIAFYELDIAIQQKEKQISDKIREIAIAALEAEPKP